MAEEWHLRYVGKEAKEIAESGLSLKSTTDLKVEIMSINTLRKSNSNHVSVALPYSSTACSFLVFSLIFIEY